jgi:hypothetical protein
VGGRGRDAGPVGADPAAVGRAGLEPSHGGPTGAHCGAGHARRHGARAAHVGGDLDPAADRAHRRGGRGRRRAGDGKRNGKRNGKRDGKRDGTRIDPYEGRK